MAKLKFISPQRSVDGIYQSVNAVADQTTFHTTLTFQSGGKDLKVYRNGVRQLLGIHYAEVDNQTIKFLSPLTARDVILLTTDGVSS